MNFAESEILVRRVAFKGRKWVSEIMSEEISNFLNVNSLEKELAQVLICF